MLTLRRLQKQFPAAARHAAPVQVLDGLSLDIHDGEIFTLLGPSGCGKTTLLRVIAGLETVDAGYIGYRGEAWVDSERALEVPARRRGIGLVFQSYAVWPHLSVFDNVAYPLRHQRVRAALLRERVLRTLHSVGLDGFEQRMPHQLSGGQQQRVAMARALVGEPGLLLLDEPFSNLDVGLRQRLRLELKELQRQLGVTVVLVTHDQEDAFALSDRIALLQHGRVEQIGTAESLHDEPASAYVHDFIGKSAQLRAEYGQAQDGRAAQALVCGLPVVPAPALALASGAAISLRVRPQDIRLVAGDGGLRGEVSHSVFAGSRYETYVRLPDGQQLMVYQSRDERSVAGQHVRIEFLAPPHVSAALSPLSTEVTAP